MQYKYPGRLACTIGALIVALTLTGCDKSGQGAGPQQAMQPEVAVVVMQPEQVAITTELPGRTAAYLVADVRPQVGGIIQKRLFEEGGDVKQGNVLYEIDPAPYQAAYDNAVASLEKAEANLPPIKSKAERYKEAVAAKAVSRQSYDEAVAALKQVEAEIEFCKAAVQSANINLGYTKLIAPISGRIGKSNVTVGALVSTHQIAPMAVIQQLDPIYVDAPQASVALLELKRQIAEGQIKGGENDQAPVKLFLEDGTPYPQEGVLKFSDVTVDPSTGSVILRMIFPNPRHTLLPGMYVRAVIEEGVIEKAILAPQQGVSRDRKGNPMVLIVDNEDKVQVRMIQTDRAIKDKWLVTSGLEPGDRVIVEGIMKVRPGVAVKVVPFGAGRTDGSAAVQTTQSAPAAK